MSEARKFTIGTEVACSDGTCGDLSHVVVDPVLRTLTHLVVEARHRQGSGRLVPIDLVESAAPAEIRLRCTMAQFQALEDAEEIQFPPGAIGAWGYQQQQMLSLPYQGIGMGPGMGVGGMPVGGMDVAPGPVIADRIPTGEVEIHRGDHVHATDGTIGKVQGLVVDLGDHQVTHVLLDEGHLWGRKRVAVPISAVKDIDDGVQLTLTKDQVRDLPPVGLVEPE